MTLLRPEALGEEETPSAPYDPLAPHYEAFVGGPGYGDWLAALLALAAENGVRGGRALDAGCGTGRSLEALLAAGFEAEGCDASPGMLREARARLGPDVQLGVAALPGPPPAGPPLDLVTALNDVVNHVAADALDVAVAALGARLRRGGLLLFDVNTARTYAGFFGATFCRDAGERFFVWESEPVDIATPGVHRARLHAFVAEPDAPGRWTRSVSRHVQHHHPHARVTAALAAAGLELVATRGQRDDAPLESHCDEAIHTKRIYLARHP